MPESHPNCSSVNPSTVPVGNNNQMKHGQILKTEINPHFFGDSWRYLVGLQKVFGRKPTHQVENIIVHEMKIHSGQIETSIRKLKILVLVERTFGSHL